jgi:hypothetical protein
MKQFRSTLLLTFAATFIATNAIGQVATGSLGGAVVDASGAAVPGAKITARNPSTGSASETVSSDAGVYVFAALPPAVYELTVEKTGFKRTQRTGVEIRVAQRLDLNIEMELGDVTQSINVAADLPQLETSTSERGSNISPQLMNNLPIFSGGIRNPRNFVSYLPGVTGGAGEMSVSGSGGRAQEVMIDGASLTIPESGGTVFNMPSMEMFQEFKMVQSTFSAEYGRFGGGVENYQTKSGTNWVHGAAFLNMRRDIWNANSWQRNATGQVRAKERFNEIGGSIGAPVFIPKVYNTDRSKTFVFFTYTKDQRPISIQGTPVNTVPTAALKNGDFSGAGMPVIYDPATTSGGIRLPFAGNAIPTSRFSNVARNILPLIPDPTRPGQASNYDFVNTQIYDRYIYSFKVDHNFTGNNRLNYFFSNEQELRTDVTNFNGPLGGGLDNTQKPWNHRVNHDWILKPNFLMHTTFGYSAQRQGWNNPAQAGYGSRIGIPNLPAAADAMPRIMWDGRAGLTNYGVQDGKVANGGQDNDTIMILQGFNWVKGRHEFKFGWDARWLYTFGFDNAGSNGQYFFRPNQTALPGAQATTGHEFASFLLGQADQANSVILPALFGRINYRDAAGYFQDNWKLNSKLTLNLGVRYEVPIGWHIPDGYTYLDLGAPNPGAANRAGSLMFAGTGAGRSGTIRPFPTDKSNIAPRLGFAYQLTPKTVLRGGFGIYYQTLGNGGCGCREGFANTNALQSDGINAAAILDNGIPPSPSYAPPPNLNPAQLNFQNASYLGPNFAIAPRIYNWSFEIQQEVFGFVASAAYQGNRGTRLASTVDLNQLPVGQLSKGSLLQQPYNSQAAINAGITAPYPGYATPTGGIPSVAQSLRPFPQYLSVFSRNAGVGKSWYDALQLRVDRRFGDFQFMFNYTWSKSLGVAHFRQIFSQLGTAIPQDYYNIDESKSFLPFDQPHITNLLTAYDLPFGRGKKYLGATNAFTNAFVGGWTISGALRYTSGNLIQITTPGNPLGNGVLFAGVTKANQTSTPIRTGIDRTSLDPNDPSKLWFNPGSLVAAPQYTLGTSAFYNNDFRNPPVLSENVSIVKRTILWQNERNPVTLVYRADGFNIFNRTAFGGIQGAIGNVNFGRATAPQVGARLITMGLRLEF